MVDIPPAKQPITAILRSPRTSRNPRARSVLAAFAVVGFGIGIGQNGASGVVQDQVADFATSVDVIGYTMVAYSLGVVVGAPLLMVGLGRVGRRPLLLAMTAMFLITTVATVLAPSIGSLMVIRFIAGLPHGALLGVASFVGAAVLGQHRRGRAVSVIMLGLTVSLIGGVPLMQWLSNEVSWRAAYVVVAIVAVVMVALVWLVTPDVPGNPHASVRTEVRSLGSRRLWVAVLTIGLGFAGLGAVFSYIVPLLEVTNDLSPAHVTWILAGWGAAMTTGAYLGGRLTDISHVGAARIGLGGATVALAGIGFLGDIPVATVVFLFMLATFVQIFSQASQVHLMEVLDGSPSLGAALSHGALNAATAIGTGLGALAIAAGWGYQAPALVALGMAVAGMVMVFTAVGYRGRVQWRRA